MKVTSDLLAREGACLGAREFFNEIFGVEAELNEENLKIYIKFNRFAFKDIHWLSNTLLNYKYRIIFREYYSNVYRKINDADKISLAVGKKLIELYDQQEREGQYVRSAALKA